MSSLFTMPIIFRVTFLTLFLLLSFECNISFAEDADLPILNVLADEESIFSYRNDKGEIVGENIEKIRAFLDGTGIKYHLDLMPWQRILRVASSTTNTLIVSIIRTEVREDNFYWLYQLSTFDDHLITRNTPEMKDITSEKILSGNYKAICSKDAIQCQFLEDFGFPQSRILRISGLTDGEVATMVLRGRADFMIDTMEDLEKEFKAKGLDVNRLYKYFKIHSSSAYLAGPKHLDPRLKSILMGEPIP